MKGETIEEQDEKRNGTSNLQEGVDRRNFDMYIPTLGATHTPSRDWTYAASATIMQLRTMEGVFMWCSCINTRT